MGVMRIGWMSNFLGRMICTVLGYMLGGVVFAVLGFLIGRKFDQALLQLKQAGGPSPFYTASGAHAQYTQGHARAHPIFLKISFQVMGSIAKSQGVVSPNSIQVAKDIMAEMHLDASQRKIAMDSFNEGKQPRFNLEQALQHLMQTRLLERFSWSTVFMDMQKRMVLADPGYSKKKEPILYLIRDYLHAQQHQDPFEQWRSFFNQSSQSSQSSGESAFKQDRTSHLNQDYVTLDVKPNATQTDIKWAYKRLMSRYHPDKLIAKKASPAAIREATEKTQMIKAAYERICKARGF